MPVHYGDANARRRERMVPCRAIGSPAMNEDDDQAARQQYQRVRKSGSKRGKSVGMLERHAPNANDQVGDRNANIGAGAGQAGRSRALT